MLRVLFSSLAGIAIAILTMHPVNAQSISVSARTVQTGQDFAIFFRVPESDPQRSFKLALVPIGTKEIPPGYIASSPGEGDWKFPAPHDPGKYMAVLAQSESNAIIQSIPVRVLITPTPGALAVSSESLTSHEKLTVSVSLPEGRSLPNPWVGLFTKGVTIDKGGTSLGDELLGMHWVDKTTKSVEFVMPRRPGLYEVRLFDRPNGPYVMDKKAIRVNAKPTPGAIQLDKQVYEVGEMVNITVEQSAKIFRQPRIAIYRPGKEEGGGKVFERSLGWEWLDLEKRTWKVQAPSTEGVYEIRLFDSEGSIQYVLDSKSFTVKASKQPGAIKVAKRVFNIGEAIEIPVSFDKARGRYGAWVGLFDAPKSASNGNAEQSIHNYGWEWVREDRVKLTAPIWPGKFELRLYDREGRFYQLDTVQIEVRAPPVPNALKLSATKLNIGEGFSVTTNLPRGRAYPSPRLSLTKVEPTQAQGGAGLTPRPIQGDWVRTDRPVEFKGLAFPGRYRITLYDRETRGFILDSKEFEVVVPQLSNAVTTDKDTYRTGEKIQVSVKLPKTRQFGGPIVGMYVVPETTEGNAPLHRNRITSQWLELDGGPYDFTAPPVAGRYQFIAFDREAGGFELGRKVFNVQSTPIDLVKINRSSYRPGEQIRVRTRVPQGLALYSPVLKLFQSSYTTENGVLAAESPISSRHIDASKDEEFALLAPGKPGKYEFRYYDRQNRYYILDIEEFLVIADTAHEEPRKYARLTPMPGSGRRVDVPNNPGSSPNPSTAAEPGNSKANTPSDEAGSKPKTNPSTGQPNTESPDAKQGEEPIDSAADDITPTAPRIFVEGMTETGLGLISELEPGASFRVRVVYQLPPSKPPNSVAVNLTGGQSMNLPLRAGNNPGVYLSNIVSVPVGTGE